MQDALPTIRANQDAIVRADSLGALTVDGRPGSGKTIVALHRAAYLLYAQPLAGQRRGKLLGADQVGDLRLTHADWAKAFGSVEDLPAASPKWPSARSWRRTRTAPYAGPGG